MLIIKPINAYGFVGKVYSMGYFMASLYPLTIWLAVCGRVANVFYKVMG